MKDSNGEIVSQKTSINSLSTRGIEVVANMVFVESDVFDIEFIIGERSIKEKIQITRVTGRTIGAKFIDPESEDILFIQDYINEQVFSNN